MFTRTSVHCADRIVATSSSSALEWTSAHSASGYVDASCLTILWTRSGLEDFEDFVDIARVEDILLLEPGAAGRRHAVLDVLQVRRRMGVGVDRQHHAHLLCLAAMDPVEIKTVGIGVQLHDFLVLLRRLEHEAQVELVPFPAE